MVIEYGIIFIATILSCFLVDNLNLGGLIRKLANSYKTQFQTMGDKALSDEEKQKLLLENVGKQVGYLLKLILFIVAFLSPFIIYILIENYSVYIDSQYLLEPMGIGISIIAVLIYILIKKFYVKIYQGGKSTS